MSTSNINPICSIRCYHDYYQDNSNFSLTCKPTVSTQDLFSRFQIYCKQTRNGFNLISANKNPVVSLLKYILSNEDLTILNFIYISGDPYWNNFTVMPTNINDNLLFSSNNPTNQVEDEDIILSPEIIKEKYSTSNGQIQIHLQDLISQLELGNVINYKVLFKAKQVKLRYYFLNVINIPLEDLTIESSSGLQFNAPKLTVLNGGVKAVLFLSKSFITLSQKPKDTIKLLKGEHTIYSDLSLPNPQNLVMIKENEEFFPLVDQFIYL